MSRFFKPPLGSTVHAEVMKGGIWSRTGHRGKATMLYERETKQFVVMTGHSGPQRRFQNYMLAVKYFNLCVGKVRP